VNPLHTVPGSNIRQVRRAFVDELAAAIQKDGWLSGSYPTVYEPVAGAEVCNLPRDQVDQLTFEIMDGAHRLAALRKLQRDPAVSAFDAQLLVQVRVIPKSPSRVQQVVSAAGENVPDLKAFARKTFCDEIWAMLAIRGVVVDRLVAFSEALAQPALDAETSGRAKAGTRETFAQVRDVLPETPKFKETYGKHIFRKLMHPGTKLRRAFNPASDMSMLTCSVVLSLVSDSASVRLQSENPISPRE
jgi:hypothetical protein